MKENTDKTPEQKVDQLWDMIKDIRFAMFTTRHIENGHLHARPMTTQNSKLDEAGSLWFFMGRDNDAVTDIQREALVNVAYADPDSDRYVSVSGEAEVVEDPAKKEALWNRAAEAWFPGGPTDPNLALVRVTIDHANYWNVKESKVTQLYKMARAVTTGKPVKDMGETGEVRMQH